MYTKSFFIVVNPVGSKFAKTLQQDLRNKVTNKVYRAGRSRTNRAAFVVTQNTLNKIQQLNRFKENDVNCPPFTTHRSGLDALGTTRIFARQLINSTNGRGIVEFDRAVQSDIPNAPLYTAYIPKQAEYRFHVFNGAIIDVQEKRRKSGYEQERNHRVRNMANGYVYCRDGVNPPNGAADLAIRATAACGYMYGAVDLIYNEKRNECFVLEVNSRPGIMGSTVDKYTDAIINTFNLRRK